MAKAVIGRTRLPEGRWLDTPSTYWLVVKRITYFDDISGNDYIQLQGEVRAEIERVRDILSEHNIVLANVATQDMLDPLQYNSVIGIAVAFKCREDLVMAKLILNVDGK